MTKQAAGATKDYSTIPRRNDVYYLDSVIFQVGSAKPSEGVMAYADSLHYVGRGWTLQSP